MTSSSPIFLHLGLFFDGSGNHAANARNDDASNIAKLFQLYPHSPHTGYLRLYIEGVGTLDGEADSFFSIATGRGSLGWLATLKKAYERTLALLQDWVSANPGQVIASLEFDLFGFSRGAACARHFANDLWAGSDSVLKRSLAQQGLRPGLSIGFMGLFDTVVSVKGIAAPPRLQLRPGMARRIVHLVAADEQRYNFALSSARAYDLSVPGSHSDIGGGYPPRMDEILVLTRPDDSSIAAHRPIESAASYQRAQALLAEGPTTLPDWGFEQRVRFWEKPVQGQRRGDRIEEVLVHAAVEGRREVRNELSVLYLQVMHRLAVSAGVPLQAWPQFDYPPELLPITRKMLAYACGDSSAPGLDAAEQALLYRRYIHHSHHWTTEILGQTSDLDLLFVHRPTPDGKRRILLP